MNYDANAQLVEGGVYDVDDAPKYKLGKTITTDDGKTLLIKATADLTAELLIKLVRLLSAQLPKMVLVKLKSCYYSNYHHECNWC